MSHACTSCASCFPAEQTGWPTGQRSLQFVARQAFVKYQVVTLQVVARTAMTQGVLNPQQQQQCNSRYADGCFHGQSVPLLNRL
ncbi:hypothetical protein [Thermogemmatispora aurantia]|uniref:hypothetical protein n=1 Tax=Thermogemmatispora aurantia TaxID=2045279 RepID=UPI00124C4833|nr:hypothetical protein [Thermogemmatispora aurantia]